MPEVEVRTDDPEEVTGLTSNDVTLIRRTWAVLVKDPTESGVTLLGLLLERYPKYIPLFPFRDVPQSELKTNGKFIEHATSTATAFNAIIEIIHDSTLLVPHLTEVGYTHLPKRVDREAFLHFKQVIIDVFSTLFQPEELTAWGKALNIIFVVILSGLSAAEQFGNDEKKTE